MADTDTVTETTGGNTADPIKDTTPPADAAATPPAEGGETTTDAAPANGKAPESTETIAGGADATPAAPAAPQDFPDNWRDILADGNKKARKELDRFVSPAAVYESWKNANDRLRSGSLLEVPGDDATDEDRAAFFKAIGVPETPAEYFDKLALPDGKVLGDDDKENFSGFAEAMHKAGATPDVVSAAVAWELDFQAQQFEAQAEADADFKVQSMAALKQELGADFKPVTNAIGTLFTDMDDEAREVLFTARDTKTGNIIGNNPAVLKWLSSLALKMNPAAEMDADDGDNLKALNDRIGELQTLSKDQTGDYWKGPRAKELQEEYAKLLGIRERSSARAA